MNTISKAFINLAMGATIAPPAGAEVTAAILQKRITHNHAPIGSIRARIYFGSGTVTLTTNTAGLVVETAGTRQVETATVTAAAGATAHGILTVTLTHPNVVGSALAVAVRLSASRHTTAALVAAAIAEALAAVPAVAAELLVTSSGATVVMTSIYPIANQVTFNLAIPAGLGVTAAATSANTTAGVAGQIIERLGGTGNDVFGQDIPATTMVTGLLLDAAVVQSGTALTYNDAASNLMKLKSGGAFGISQLDGMAGVSSVTLTTTGRAMVDMLLHLG